MNTPKKLKILLVQSYIGKSEPPILPLGLALLAGSIKDHEVDILDLNVKNEPFKVLEDTLLQFKPDLVGVSIRNIDSTNKRNVIFYYEYLKPTLKQILFNGRSPIIVLGGAGFSIFAERIMQDAEEADFGVLLEGEETFPELLENLNHPEEVKGLFYRDKGKINFTGNGNFPDIERIPQPRWDLLEIEKYFCFPEGVGVETKRGCSLKCSYCPYPFLNGHNYRLKSAPSVVDEIEELQKKYNVKQFTFTDSIFNIPLSHAEEICQDLIDRNVGVQWAAWFNEKTITKEFLSLAKRAGCTNFIFSPDGFSNAVLEKMQKNIRKKDILRTFNILKEVSDIRVSYNFFKNPPGQNLATAWQMIKFFLKAKRELGKNRVSFELNSLRVEPHTYLCMIAVEEGVIKKNEDLLFPKYYSNPKTRYIEKGFNMLLRLKGKQSWFL